MSGKRKIRVSRAATHFARGVYVQEVSAFPKSISGVSTSTTVFIGPTRKGPMSQAVEIRSFADYQKTFGALLLTSETGHAVRQFFINGGVIAHVVRITKTATATEVRPAFNSLKSIDTFGILALPGNSDIATLSYAARFCLKHRVFLIVDPPKRANTPTAVQSFVNSLRPSGRTNAAVYFPWINILDPVSRKLRAIPPSGSVAGIFAATDVRRGVWKAPANIVVSGARSLGYDVSTAENTVLNADGINCIRRFPARGIRVWGARTISSDQEWKYVNVRRLLLFLEKSIQRGTGWVVFEPNVPQLWRNVRLAIENFLTTQWRSGAFQGSKPEHAFFVRCDRSTMTQNDIDNGRLIAQIGVAPVKPAEFVIFPIQQKTMRVN